MPVLQRIALLSFIVFFSGSMVVFGARIMRDELKEPSTADIERARRLVRALRGDELFKRQAKYSEGNEMPPRKPRSYLPDYDIKKIKSFLGSLIGADGKEPDEGEDAE